VQSLAAVQRRTVWVPAVQLEGGLSVHDAAATQDEVSDVAPFAHPFAVVPIPLSTRVPQHTSPDA